VFPADTAASDLRLAKNGPASSTLHPRARRLNLAARFPVVHLVGQRGAAGEQRHPGAERC
jgi:hypothetical protein